MVSWIAAGRGAAARRRDPPYRSMNRQYDVVCANSSESGTYPPVQDAVSAADAHRRFAEILRKVRNGRSITVTSRGKPVARIVPISGHGAASGEAKAALLARLRAEPVIAIERRSRAELYEG